MGVESTKNFFLLYPFDYALSQEPASVPVEKFPLRWGYHVSGTCGEETRLFKINPVLTVIDQG